MQLTENFSTAEFERSATAHSLGLNNTMPPAHAMNALRLCESVLQPLRDYYGRAVTITSGYRGEALNKAVGGAKNSQHCTGEAADIKVEGVPEIEVFRHIVKNLNFDQCIYEMELDSDGNTQAIWVHVSCAANGKNRHEALKARRVGKGKAVYQQYRG